jgi:hypothetical protein
MSTKVTEVFELRLSDAQIAAIDQRNYRRRKKHMGGCAFIDLGDVSSADGSDLSEAERRALDSVIRSEVQVKDSRTGCRVSIA